MSGARTPSRRRPRGDLHRAGAAALLACALFAVAGCGAEPDRDGLTRRLDLAPEPGASVPDPRVDQRWDFAADLDAWRVTAPSAELCSPRAGEARRLCLRGVEADGDMLFDRPGVFAPERFNRVRLVGSFLGSGWLLASVWRGDQLLMLSQVTHLEQSADPYATEVDLVRVPGADLSTPGDRLQLVLRGGNRNAQWVFAELEHAPLAARLPDPAGEPEMILVGAEGRTGEGLVTGRDLLASVDVPAGGELRFALARPTSVARASAPARVVVSAEATGRAPQLLWRGTPDDGAGWHAERVSLAEFAGQRLTLRFALDAEGEAAWGLAEAAVVVRGRATPPVLLITTDTHRGDHVGAVDAVRAPPTPALDAFAAQGLLFEDAWSPTNSTNPAHVALMTGLHPRDTGIVVNRRPLSAAADTLAERFAAAGYATHAVLSTKHLGHEGSGLGQGFDRMTWAPNKPLDAEQGVDTLFDWLDEAQGRPLFVWLHVFDAHWPYDAPGRWRDADARRPDDAGRAPPAGVLPGGYEGPVDTAALRAAYRSEVRYLDDQLRRVFEAPALRDAVIAIVGDHGEGLGEQDSWFDHAGLNRGTLHVPLALRAPSLPGGERRAEAATPLGLGRTLLELAGVDAGGFPGRSLLEPSSRAEPRWFLSANSREAAVRLGDELLVLSLMAHHPRSVSRARELHQVELFDLAADPDCARDLVDARPARAAELRGRLIDWLDAAPAEGLAGGATEDPELLRQLSELGYVDHDPDAGTASLFERDDCAWCARFEAR